MENVRIRRVFLSVFPRIQIEYGDLDSVRMWQNTDEKKPILDNFHAVLPDEATDHICLT